MKVVTEKLQIQIDEEGNLMESNHSKMEKELRSCTVDLELLKKEYAGMVKGLQEKQARMNEENASLAAAVEMESMLAKVESKEVNQKLQKVLKTFEGSDDVLKEKFDQFLKGTTDLKVDQSPEDKEQQANKMKEIADAKVEEAFERLRNDNLYIWKESIKLAEEEFNLKGVGETMNFLPKTLLDRKDLKRTVNGLINEEELLPKPVLS
mmetsp:Transcript_2287/g.2230  ORF Transcript_2287/g.2230 Transcript_2287/m.2230 type:complete len:208 (+) Transcript_2287:2274-2897(+)